MKGTVFLWAAVSAITGRLLLPAYAFGGEYTLQDLGPVGSSQNSYTGGFQSINNLGQVVGVALPGTEQIAFRTNPRGIITPSTYLGELGGTISEAFGINDSGQAVGEFYAQGNVYTRPFRTAPNGVITPASDLGSLGGNLGAAWAVNVHGQAVGASQTPSGFIHAFRTAPNGPITPASDLGTPPGVFSEAFGINASGQVVGDVDNRAYRTMPNGMITADSYIEPLGSESVAYGINDAGQAVGGAATTGNAAEHAFRTAPNGPVSAASDLGTLGGQWSRALAINSCGQAVGFSEIAPGDYEFHAFFCDVTGPMQDLNNLIAPHSGWVLREACGINDAGEIAGWGLAPDGTNRAFLLTIPEPGIVLLVATVAPAFLVRRRRAAIFPRGGEIATETVSPVRWAMSITRTRRGWHRRGGPEVTFCSD